MCYDNPKTKEMLNMLSCDGADVKFRKSPEWQSSPIQPGRHAQLPVTLSHLPPFVQLQAWVQFSP